MPCTTSSSSCASCKKRFTALKDTKLLASQLNYTQGTWPVIFENDITFKGPFNESNTRFPDVAALRDTISDRLKTRFSPAPVVNANFEAEFEEGKALHVFQSVLVDFPYKFDLQPEFISWLVLDLEVQAGKRKATKREREKELKGDMGSGWKKLPSVLVRMDQWEVYLPDESHPCLDRLHWFVEANGLGDKVGP
ncbi:hypothetical protein BJY04DRAFT_222526 [Aspergillus karnatakaensis]|uniref:uncharacterized protein n=1 Tax=Aspergillus karnatakaensis TaxID=1810916 RepID=UPI003CCE4AA2